MIKAEQLAPQRLNYTIIKSCKHAHVRKNGTKEKTKAPQASQTQLTTPVSLYTSKL